MFLRPPSLHLLFSPLFFFFFFNDTATTEIYTLSLHDALPIYTGSASRASSPSSASAAAPSRSRSSASTPASRSVSWRSSRRSCRSHSRSRSEEHTSELQSLTNLVCRLLLEKKKKVSYLLHIVT